MFSVNALERSLNTRIQTGRLMERIAQLSGFDQRVASAATRVEALERALTKNEDENIDELEYLNQNNGYDLESVKEFFSSDVGF